MRFLLFILTFTLLISPVSIFAETTFELTGGDSIKGTITGETIDTYTISHIDLGEITLQKEKISKTSSPSAQKTKPEIELKREISAGFNKSSGNTVSENFNLGMDINRKTSKNETTFKSTYTESSSDKKMTEQKWYVLGRYAYSFGKKLKWYNFYKTEIDHAKFSKIDYRIIPAAGYGYWFSDTEGLKAMIECALGYEHIKYNDSSKDDNNAMLIPRANIEWKFWKDLSFGQELTAFLTVNESNDYRILSKSGLKCPLTDELCIKVDVINEYTAQPAEGAKKSDRTISSSLAYSF